MSTLGGFLSVAGGLLAGVGALTGEKDLMKLGGLMSLGGAATNALTSAGEMALDTAGQGAASSVEAADAMRAAEHGTAALTSAAQAPTIGTLGQQAAQAGAANPFVTPDSLATDALQVGGKAAQAPSLMQRAAEVSQASTPQSIGQQLTAAPIDPVAKAGASMDSGTLQSLLGSAWDKTKALATGAGQLVKNNKELVQIGAGALQSMYGPEAEQLDLQRSIMARRLANLNSPIRLTTNAGV